MQVSFDASGVTSFKQQDQYMLSTGTGKLYEGSAGQIKKEIQNDIHKESFASPEQKQGIAGLKNFDAIVAERGQNNKSAADSIQLTPPSSLSPFKTAPKPE